MKKSSIATALIATSILLNLAAAVMMVIQLVKVVSFSRLMMLNELGMWVEVFKADPVYSLTLIGMSVVAFVIWFAGKVIDQMVKDEEAKKAKEWYKLGK